MSKQHETTVGERIPGKGQAPHEDWLILASNYDDTDTESDPGLWPCGARVLLFSLATKSGTRAAPLTARMQVSETRFRMHRVCGLVSARTAGFRTYSPGRPLTFTFPHLIRVSFIVAFSLLLLLLIGLCKYTQFRCFLPLYGTYWVVLQGTGQL